MPEATGGETLVFVGTYTKTNSEGIYTFSMDNDTGALRQLSVIGGIVDPSFLAIHPSGRFLYSTSEIEDAGGGETGYMAAYAIDRASGELTYLNRQDSLGTAPCHAAVDSTGSLLLAANYETGSAVVFPINSDGSLDGPSCKIQHHGGSNVHPDRQEGPHAHSVTIDAADRFVYVADLGLDQVRVYELDSGAGSLTPTASPWVQSAPGAGPRHFDFHPSGRFACVINEIGSTLSSYACDPGAGALTHLQTASTLPDDFDGVNHTSDLHFAPDGRFIYGSNRGHHSIAIFAFDESSGAITPVGHESTQGETPRNFGIDPSDNFLLAANQDTDTIVTFRRNAQTGLLSETGHVAQVPMPVCMKFLPL